MSEADQIVKSILGGIRSRGRDGVGRAEYVHRLGPGPEWAVAITPGDYSILEHEGTIYRIDGEVEFPNDLAGHVFAEAPEEVPFLGLFELLAPLLAEPFVVQTAWVEDLVGEGDDTTSFFIGFAVVARPYDINNPHSHQR